MIPPTKKLRVAVLMGGSSSERPVSLSTGRQIVEALNRERYLVTSIDTQDLLGLSGGQLSLPPPSDTRQSESTLQTGEPSERSEDSIEWSRGSGERSGESIENIAGNAVRESQTHDAPMGRPDVVFIALHGKGGEDGTVQGLLEFMGLAYTGSGVLASALAMDKTLTKRLLHGAGIPVIEAVTVSRPQARSLTSFAEAESHVNRSLGFPVFVKPNAEGSTFGCTLVESAENLYAAVSKALEYDTLAVIERYIQGVEITVGVLEAADGTPEALPVIEIVPRSAYYDYESKYAPGGSDHIIPARIPESLRKRAQLLAVRCHTLLGCRGMSRTDMIVSRQDQTGQDQNWQDQTRQDQNWQDQTRQDQNWQDQTRQDQIGDGKQDLEEDLYLLEVNTIPGMTPTSLLPQAAAHAGIAFPELLDRLIYAALKVRSSS